MVQVRLTSSRPLSKRKHWIVSEILRRARIFEAPVPSKLEAPETSTLNNNATTGHAANMRTDTSWEREREKVFLQLLQRLNLSGYVCCRAELLKNASSLNSFENGVVLFRSDFQHKGRFWSIWMLQPSGKNDHNSLVSICTSYVHLNRIFVGDFVLAWLYCTSCQQLWMLLF